MLVKSEGRLDFSSREEEEKRTDHNVLEGENCVHTGYCRLKILYGILPRSS